MPLFDYLPIVGPLITTIKDLFEKTEEEKLRKDIDKYAEWHARYISFKEGGGRKRKNMLNEDAFLLLVTPLRTRLKEIRDAERGTIYTGE